MLGSPQRIGHAGREINGFASVRPVPAGAVRAAALRAGAVVAQRARTMRTMRTMRTLDWRGAPRALGDALERLAEAEHDRILLWTPVCFGIGITAWFLLDRFVDWNRFAGAMALLSLGAAVLSRGSRVLRALAIAALLALLGLEWIAIRADVAQHPVLARAVVATFDARVQAVEHLPAREMVRLTVAPIAGGELPARVRVNVPEAKMPPGAGKGAVVALRARLMPPASAAVPGGYDFARVAWFAGIGATGSAFDIAVRKPGEVVGGGLRERLAVHVREAVPGAAGAIAATLATGDRGALSEEDAEAMRRSGLAHLLSISGLHVTAVTGAAMLLVLRLLALSPALALRIRLPVVAAGAGAVAAVGYTLLTGAEVPTIRSCVAALLILGAIALGRQALTLRLVAAGAMFVLLLWPQSLAGPSFQLSFAAVTAIVALHESRWMRALVARREESWFRRLGRAVLALFVTGLVVEIALMPIAIFHFHKAGIYGALANIVAIPLTTFLIMPAEAGALLLDLVGLGAPLWWIAGVALRALLGIAHAAADAPGSVTMLPVAPHGAFVLMIAGGLWIALWRTGLRWAGVPAIAAGAAWALAAPAPNLIVTGDGRHLAVRDGDGTMRILRERAGDYVRANLGEAMGSETMLAPLAEDPRARCSPDVCVTRLTAADGSQWIVAATRSRLMLPYRTFVAFCAKVDILVSDRRLPEGCRPRRLKLDRALLDQRGGVAVTLSASGAALRSVTRNGDRHPWVRPSVVAPVPGWLLRAEPGANSVRRPGWPGPSRRPQ